MTETWYALPLLLLVGLVTGVINIVAGGGSLLTLPVLIFLGLPATVANGTNRIGILVQNVAAVWGFGRHGLLQRGWIVAAALPATVGAVLGAWLAVRIDDRAFERVLAGVMLIAVLATLWGPGRRLVRGGEPAGGGGAGRGAATGGSPDRGPPPAEDADPDRLRAPLLLLLFFGAGVYAGFVQAGVGFLLLAGAVLGGLDLVRGNALKVLVLLILTPVVLLLFIHGDKVAWLPGITLAAGNLAGALLGVRLTVTRGQRWLRRAVTVALLLFAVLLWV